jgi:flagellar hook assembly protein FlgD
MALKGEFESNLIQIEPQVFDPEGSFGLTFTSIRYELDQPGWVGSFSIYSASGHLVQILAQNQLLGMEGLFTWKGTDATGAKVRSGYYILLVELFDLNGQLSVIKKGIVVGTKL